MMYAYLPPSAFGIRPGRDNNADQADDSERTFFIIHQIKIKIQPHPPSGVELCHQGILTKEIPAIRPQRFNIIQAQHSVRVTNILFVITVF